ncbi:methylated-DNA--[protein]-cysteine S-methyltransferase [Chitinimonas koreensis]|uniref:methylated-DNA--[protein]-cysteine S-methyltransferase n=1 Tax=Chitinimonas koreensis TaxID=356302 RepID=UPI00040DDDB4|nr:methylated-DNA--[protein]-cysteine S-methyltransferase [Chitinimonas koreensis]
MEFDDAQPLPARSLARRAATWDALDSPFGRMVAVADGQNGLLSLSFGAAAEDEARAAGARHAPAALAEVIHQLAQYLAGERRQFELPLAPEGTPFQHAVWAQLVQIPYGETVSYGELAAALGQPGAARAVGRANATNPIALIVPCHRVIGGDGSLTGYAGGLPRKQALLAFERRHRPPAGSSLGLFD